MCQNFLLSLAVIFVSVYICEADDIFLDDDLDDSDTDFDTDGFSSENLINSIKGAMDTLFEYVGDENGCIYKCPNGAKPVKKPNHKPKANGCGAFGMKLDTTHVPAIEQCCNEHDLCYHTCNRSKTTCDDHFRDCLAAICKDIQKFVSRQLYDGCRSTADIMYAATMALGCKPYKDSQKDACLCPATRAELR